MALLIASRGSFGMMARRCRPGCIALARHSLGNKPAGCAVRAVSTVASLPSRQLGCSSAGQLQTGPEMLATSDTHTILPQLLESSHRSWEGGPIAAAIGGIAAGAALAAADSGDSADAVSYHDKVVGAYENRIRAYSAPEKVFEYFASVVPADEDEVYMTPGDFMRAITPFNEFVGGEVGTKNWKYDNKATRSRLTEAQRNKYKAAISSVTADNSVSAEEAKELSRLQEELGVDNTTHVAVLKELGLSIRQFDTMMHDKAGLPLDSFYDIIDGDGDGLISYGEYIFFVTLLSTPEAKFDLALRIYDVDGSGGISQAEFVRMLKTIRRDNPTGEKVRDSNLLGDKGRVDHAAQLKLFFGDSMDEALTPDKFHAYVRKLRHAVREHEFKRWDKDGTGTLSAYEFAVFLVTYAPSSMLDALMKRADALKGVPGSVSLEQYEAFHDLLLKLDELEVALDMVLLDGKPGHVSRDEFLRAASAAANSNELEKKEKVERFATEISDVQVDVIFRLFDSDGNGDLDDSEFLHIMRHRTGRGMGQRRDLGVVDMITRIGKCASAAMHEE